MCGASSRHLVNGQHMGTPVSQSEWVEPQRFGSEGVNDRQQAIIDNLVDDNIGQVVAHTRHVAV